MVAAASLSALAGVACALRLSSANVPELRRMVWFVCAVPISNSVLHIAVTRDIAPTDMVILSIVGIGAVAPKLRPGVILTLAGLSTWVAVVLTGGPFPDGAVLKHAINLGLASVLAFAVFSIRALISERLRLAEVRLTERVEELDEARHQLEQASTTDKLTGCFNRRGWDDRVEALHRLARREGASLTLGIIDLDRFKEYNDTFGHQAGDELLTTFARQAASALRDVDVLARWGGDEFTVALYGCGVDEATSIVGRIAEANRGTSGCSIGFVQVRPDETVAGAMSRADLALYRVKRGGRGRIAHCTCETGATACLEDEPLSTPA
jgi:diguanylate cyclase (GGDEF)-like protein